MVHLFGKLLQS